MGKPIHTPDRQTKRQGDFYDDAASASMLPGIYVSDWLKQDRTGNYDPSDLAQRIRNTVVAAVVLSGGSVTTANEVLESLGQGVAEPMPIKQGDSQKATNNAWKIATRLLKDNARPTFDSLEHVA